MLLLATCWTPALLGSHAVRAKRCLILSTPVLWQCLMADCLSYARRTTSRSHGWLTIVHDAFDRRSYRKFSCRWETARYFVSLNISISRSRSFEVTGHILRLSPTVSEIFSMTLKSVLGVIQENWKWHHSIDRIRVPVGPMLYHFRDKARYWSKTAIFRLPDGA